MKLLIFNINILLYLIKFLLEKSKIYSKIQLFHINRVINLTWRH